MKKYHQLDSLQRYAIQEGLKAGKTQAEIAQLIGVSQSTISREIKRHRQKRGGYNANHAHTLAEEVKERI